MLPPSGMPNLEREHILPVDLREFYKSCGGVSLFKRQSYSYRILRPSEMVLANPILIGERAEYDITSSWYLLAKDHDNQFLTIDCSPTRLGRCYDSFIDRHGIVGGCPVVAISFSDLLERLFRTQGGYPYWLRDDFISLGDAYDL